MTVPRSSADLASLAGLPAVVLDPDGLDRLELVLGGWLPPSALPVDAGTGGGREVVLTDAENTPRPGHRRRPPTPARRAAVGSMTRVVAPTGTGGAP